MDSERWAKIDRLLDEAMDRDQQSRAAFLDEACLGDEDLRREVESLLKAHSRAEPFLSTPALDVAARHLARENHISLVGKQFGSYHVLSALGAGGMGEVYLARDERLGRKLALKLLPRRFILEADRVRRFEQEARAASALNHPNIITIYDMGEMAETYFIASEYVEGETLRQLISRGPIRTKEAMDICAQVADALAAAHEAGLVHRDLKPENVMVRPDGYVKVLDFGLVKLTERGSLEQNNNSSDTHRTNPGTVLGTVAYMSPEQASGIEVDNRSDLFSLGVLMYELLTGVVPFKGRSTVSTLDAIINHQPASLSSVNEGASAEMERIVNRALEKDRDLRYQTASDLRSELKRLQRELYSASMNSGDVATSRPSKTGSSAVTLSKPVAAALFASLLLLAALSLVFWLRTSDKPEPSPWLGARSSQVTDFQREELFPSLSPDGKTIAYARNSDGYWKIFAQRVGGSNAQNLTGSTQGDDTQPAFSPNGAYIAFRSERDGGGVFVMGASGESIRRLSDRGPAFHPAWSPDSQEVIYTEERIRDPRERAIAPRRLWAVNIKTLEKRLLITRDVAQPQWSPNGHRLAYWASDASSQRDIWTITPTGDSPVQITNDVATDWNPTWSPDGKYLYFVSDRSGAMQVWRVAIEEQTGRPLSEPELVPTPSAFAQHISLSRDGNRLAFVSAKLNRNLYRVEIDPRSQRVIGQPETQTQWARQGVDLDLSPDGQRLAYTTVSDTEEDLAIINSDGSGELTWLTDDEYKDRGPRWSPDGKRIAFYSTRGGHFEIWLINADGTGLRRLTESVNNKAYTPVWSPDGKRLTFTNSNGETWLIEVDKPWSEQTPQLLNPKREPPVRFWPSAWSSDGRRLLGGSNLDGQTLGLSIYSFETGRLERIGNIGSSSMAWLQDNRRALFSVDGTVFIIDTETKTQHPLFSGAPGKIISFRLSRDYRWLYYIQESAEADIWLLIHK
ncbi:MAG TPA: LpqB family beta-propeller domain-containing protein [Blastocatellia bacterium]|nr:LpqB family beta-propeller domain-containing protein [Blastocatellia bacterium]